MADMSSPQLPSWDVLSTPPQRLSTTDQSSSPATSVASRTFSNRLSASSSSLASSPALRDSFEIYSSTAKSTLEQVREESSTSVHIENENFGDRSFFRQGNLPADDSGLYNFDDEPSHSSQEAFPAPKKARSGDSSISPAVPVPTTKRFNSLSKRWKARTGAGPKLSIDVASSYTDRSRKSSAASTILSPAISTISTQDSRLPPSPARTVFEESIKETGVSPIDIEKANSHQEEDQSHARTPLLPPTLMAIASQKVSPVQSPLQSPTVADSGFFTDVSTPADTPQLCSLPSPLLSTKPSIASIRQRSRAGTMIPSADIPPMIIDADDEDTWSAKLGHANFTILPEPYLPTTLTLEDCKQFREAYELAKTNFLKHLAHTGEHCGPTSKVFKLTEDKWAEIVTQWDKYDAEVSRAIAQFEIKQDAQIMDLAQSSSESVPMPQIPAADIVKGKFPVLGDEDIIGPMSVGPALKRLISTESTIRLSKRRNLFKLLSDLLARGNIRS